MSWVTGPAEPITFAVKPFNLLNFAVANYKLSVHSCLHCTCIHIKSIFNTSVTLINTLHVNYIYNKSRNTLQYRLLQSRTDNLVNIVCISFLVIIFTLPLVNCKCTCIPHRTAPHTKVLSAD